MIGDLGPALIGLVLFAFQEGARRASRDARLSARRLLPRRTAVGDHVRVRLNVEASSPLPLDVADEVPDAFAVLSRRSVGDRGRAEEELVLRPREPGEAKWKDIEVRISDPWGLHHSTRRLPVPGKLPIAPEPFWELEGKRTGRRHAIQTTVPRRLAIEPTIDIETVREWQPGDRVRDIDWPRTSRLGTMHTRERQRVAPRPFLILLDATQTMRTKRRMAKLSTAVRLAYGLAGTAAAAGVTATLVAFTEDGVTRTAGAKGRRKKIHDVLDALMKLPPAEPAGAGSLEAAGRELRPEERAVAEALAPFRAAPIEGKSPLDQALAALSRSITGPAFVIAILDAEIQPRAAEHAIHRLGIGGHKAVVVAPATGAHHFRRREASGPVLRNLVEARLRRERLRRRLAGRHVPVFSLRPDNATDILEEVARWAR